MSHKGRCTCGAVRLEVAGQAEAMGYCHCRSCRSWSGAPVNAFTLWKPQAVRITAGVDLIARYQRTADVQRQYCALCGGHLMAVHPKLDLVDVYAGTLPTLPFIPTVHINYFEHVLSFEDGLPKLGEFQIESDDHEQIEFKRGARTQ
jgi:hypothetical protein